MKKIEDMLGTKRMAIKFYDDTKITIDSKVIGGKERYIVKVSKNIQFDGINIDESLLVLENMCMNKEDTIFRISVLENIGLKTIYVNDRGIIKERVKAYYINPEEDYNISSILYNAFEIKEITYDSLMISKMLENGIIKGENAILSSYGLIKPNLTTIKGGKGLQKKWIPSIIY